MKKRIITGLILALVLTPIVVINNSFVFIIFQIVMGVFVAIAAWEMLRMFEKEKPISKTSKTIIIGLTLLTFINIFLSLGKEWQEYGSMSLLGWEVNNLVILLLTTVAIFGLFVFVPKFSSTDIGRALTIIHYVGFSAASLSALRFLGVRVIVYVVLVSTMTDIFAYFIGVTFGKHKMAPHISPKKSWEGAIGGTIMATIIGSCFALFYGDIFPSTGFLGELLNSDGWKTIFDGFSSLGDIPLAAQVLIVVPITMFGSIAAQIGDLVASKLKRTYQIKDFGNIFPGHGGILDRFDSVLFISILFVGIILGIQAVFPLI